MRRSPHPSGYSEGTQKSGAVVRRLGRVASPEPLSLSLAAPLVPPPDLPSGTSFRIVTGATFRLLVLSEQGPGDHAAHGHHASVSFRKLAGQKLFRLNLGSALQVPLPVPKGPTAPCHTHPRPVSGS
ncbi:hypothetical protein SSPO_094800 [Streptomyces antimycoticus]|uniref:Uncharacterized protein n=1 Tax=Streptomyces antimycoticus TaxID=68175 RepID=A0A499UZW7_9ACTN|nr:hypothetical protein SSPO_094800 [Streptomyces antimycoticus]